MKIFRFFDALTFLNEIFKYFPLYKLKSGIFSKNFSSGPESSLENLIYLSKNSRVEPMLVPGTGLKVF